MNDEMNVERYLRRIGYRGAYRPTLDVLRRLHRRHLLSVPFENLDIHLGRPIILDTRLFFKKIVEEGRGGYCYELNGCFSWLLRRLGFKVWKLSARVAGKDGSFSPEFDHLTLLVHLGERWLVDVGFGDSFTEPKQIDNPDPQKDGEYLYRITKISRSKHVSRKKETDGSWQLLYAFGLRPQKLANFRARNRFQQTSSQSHFTQGRLISKLTSSGRVTLTERKLILARNNKRIERAVRNHQEFDGLLFKHFRLQIQKDLLTHSGSASSG